MPPGAVGPFITRFDAGSVPVAQLVFSSPTRTVGEMQDIALNRVRPIFATLPGNALPTKGLFLAGEYTESSSIHGAITSGEKAAQAVLEFLKEE